MLSRGGGQTLSTFHYTLLEKCRALLSVVERGWPNALDFSLDLAFNIPPMYYLMNNSFMECFVHYLMNSNCTCVPSTTLDNFALDQTSLDTKQSSRLHSTRWPNALDVSLNMHVERCIVKSRERLARALDLFLALDYSHTTTKVRVSVACSSFVSRKSDQFSFWTQKSMMIATCTLRYKRAFSDVL